MIHRCKILFILSMALLIQGCGDDDDSNTPTISQVCQDLNTRTDQIDGTNQNVTIDLTGAKTNEQITINYVQNAHAVPLQAWFNPYSSPTSDVLNNVSGTGTVTVGIISGATDLFLRSSGNPTDWSLSYSCTKAP